ncbi:MAG: Maf family nucleotide pyrophosphatase [Bacteroidales bacterium]|nr:Maf family nucleotide pyrophosphatase [Bacteroidales bacterium]
MWTDSKNASDRMNTRFSNIILSSGSPRRRELLAGLGLEFTVDTGNTFEEIVPEGTAPRDIPRLMSIGKSHGFHRPLEEGELLITSDTMVIADDTPLGKPADKADAVRMLKLLQGRSHDVITAVTLRDIAKETTFEDVSHVRLSPLSDEEINYYVDNYKVLDKAGAYAIQEWIGYAAIEGIDGSFYTVMGLPVHLVYQNIRKF